MRRVALTTKDNKFNPITEFADWFKFDTDPQHPYSTSCVLARISFESEELSEEENMKIREAAIDELIALDPFDVYRKVVVED